MHFPLGDKNLVELKHLLEDIKKAIDLIERQKSQREKQRAIEARKPSLMKHKTPPKPPAPRSPRAPIVQTAKPTPTPREAVKAPVAPSLQPQPPISRPPVPLAPQIKYMHPVNRNLTWDGTGPQPDWIMVYLERGGSWSALENTAQLFARRHPHSSPGF